MSIVRAAVGLVVCSLVQWGASAGEVTDGTVIDIGSRRELFVDAFLIDQMDGTELRMHVPCLVRPSQTPRPDGHYATVLKDGGLFRSYGRGDKKAGSHWKTDGWEAYHLGEVTLYAESDDGIHWREPNLGLYHVERYPNGNVVLGDEFLVNHNFTPLIDARPDVPATEKYKALGGGRYRKVDEHLRAKYEPGGLYAYASQDAIHWRRLHDNAVIPEDWGSFDSQNVAFWSESEARYVCYFRVITDGVRSIARSTSNDFIRWTEPVAMKANVPGEHLYTSGTQPYFRAPHIYIALPTRFMANRGSTTDVMLMSTRGGDCYDRTFMEAFIRPGVGTDGWGNRSNYAAIGVHQTGPFEMSIYLTGTRRYAMRLDGFSSLHAGYREGAMVTKPFKFKGEQLDVNYSTSAGGLLRVEIEDASGKPLPGFELDACKPLIGDEVERAVEWQGQGATSLATISGTVIRLKVVMEDADLYSFRFH